MSTKSKTRSNSSTSSDCVLCCEHITLYAVGPCDHPTCYKCSSRMRVLINQKYCAICRADVPMVIFTSELKPYEVLKSTKQKKLINSNHGIQFLSQAALQKFENLLVYKCHVCKHPNDLLTFDKLRSHMRKEHHKQYCSICVDKLHVFPTEYRTYTQKDLITHRKTGDSDNSSFRGHPECRFCDDRYLDNDELLNHLRKHHFWCHFCERDGKQDYYDGYTSLRDHFRTSHYLCEEENCKTEEYTAVFRHKLDLQAHIVERHPHGLTKQEAKKQRNVNVNLEYRDCRINRSRPFTLDDMSQISRRTNIAPAVNNPQEQSAPSVPQSRTDMGDPPPSDLEKVYGVEATSKPKSKPIDNHTTKDINQVASSNPRPLETDFPSLSTSSETAGQASWGTDNDPSVKKKKNKSESNSPNLGRTWNKLLPDMQDSDAFPGLPAKAKKNKQNSKGKTKPNVSMKSQTPAKPPPGLSRSSNKPPGFAAVAGSSPKPTVKSTNMPPGFSEKASSPRNPVVNSSKHQPGPTTTSAPITTNGVKPVQKPLVQSKASLEESNMRERNARLIQMFQTFLNNDQLFYFRQLSAHFRKEEIPSQLYYEEISLLFGKNLNKVFSELVALLPDTTKQEELLELHMANKALLKQNENVNPVPSNSYRDMCAQPEVEKVEKQESTSVSPPVEGDFPALPAGTNHRRRMKPYRAPSHVYVPKNAWGSQ